VAGSGRGDARLHVSRLDRGEPAERCGEFLGMVWRGAGYDEQDAISGSVAFGCIGASATPKRFSTASTSTRPAAGASLRKACAASLRKRRMTAMRRLSCAAASGGTGPAKPATVGGGSTQNPAAKRPETIQSDGRRWGARRAIDMVDPSWTKPC
jgi:hypothetical protein